MEKQQIKNWKFILKDEAEAWQKDFDDANWSEVQVPHDWSIHQDFSRQASTGTGSLPGGIGWYRATFPFEKKVAATKYRLVFEGVYKNTQVWVNGYHVGGRPSGYASFSFDFTDILNENHNDQVVIAVKVNHTDIADSRWYNGSGINRPVWLESHQSWQIAEYGTFFQTKTVDQNDATILLEQKIINDDLKNRQVRIQQTLRSLTNGQEYQFKQVENFQPFEEKKVIFNEQLTGVELWSAENPRLYRLTTELFDQETLEVSTYQELIGIREFSFNPDSGFFINGKNEKIKGVCLHEDAGSFGTAVPVEVWTRRLLKLKEAGVNGIRMAHNPHSQVLYKLCDLLGFYVIDEAFDEWENPKNKWWQGHNVYPPKHEGYAEFFPNWYRQDLENMVRLNINHPSIISWSIGNEVDYPNDPYANPLFAEMKGNNDSAKPAAERMYNPNRPDTRRLSSIAEKLIQVIKEIDTTRPVTLAAAFPELSSQTGLLDHLDLIGYNYKEHLYEKDHQRFPKQPFIGSENGHSYQQWLAVKNNDYIAAQFIWTGFDYLGEAFGWPIHGSGQGMLTLAGFPKPNWFLRKSWWTKKATATLFTRPIRSDNTGDGPFYRQWNYLTGESVEVFCFSNCENAKLMIGEKNYPMTYDQEFGYFKAVVLAEDSLLKVICKTGQEELATDYLTPSRGACLLDLKSWTLREKLAKLLVSADLLSDEDEHVYQIEGKLIDNQGELSANDLMAQVQVQNGELLGIENGNLADITSYDEPYRSTFNGRIIIFVKGTPQTKVVVSLPGIKNQELVLSEFTNEDSKENPI
ncbi:glycoside hydrolase family 2 TIM barrel-domain containing protein [Enterococcus timonensis]|uniref:glycoside hydrolase family 2 TIM barrel-domain containing protein n=1 Tax=Enterococcus timonensis TaxID=1852364 RepID=UPI0008DB091C|nr:glycoside hydrolase family 2 TIM barrel-domain containing protein [Enterococcus timonensis]